MNTELRLVEFTYEDYVITDEAAGMGELSKIIKKGYFHKWATFSDSTQTEELAIIEDLDGNVHLIKPTDVKFITINDFPCL